MEDNGIHRFFSRFGGARSLLSHALSRGVTTMQRLWASEHLNDKCRIWIGTRPGVLGNAEVRPFACKCVHLLHPLLEDHKAAFRALTVATNYSNKKASGEEMASAALLAKESLRKHSVSTCFRFATDRSYDDWDIKKEAAAGYAIEAAILCCHPSLLLCDAVDLVQKAADGYTQMDMLEVGPTIAKWLKSMKVSFR
jgi:hypothetical protein